MLMGSFCDAGGDGGHFGDNFNSDSNFSKPGGKYPDFLWYIETDRIIKIEFIFGLDLLHALN